MTDEKVFVTFLPSKTTVIEPRNALPLAEAGIAHMHVATEFAMRCVRARNVAPPALAAQFTVPLWIAAPVSLRTALIDIENAPPARGRLGDVLNFVATSLSGAVFTSNG